MKTLAYRFNDVVEKIYKLPLDEKVELKSLLENNIAEERRNEILTHFKKANAEVNGKELIFSSDINELKRML